uniref:Germin-like protein n=1 Tax=Ziziphus jujuba TaxID=326968 RepID=A0A6P4AYU9_ZIZJJ|nr:germin-like protein subfamily 1 member 14 [Ziziphus jujuba var. spinosa]
MQGVHVLLPLLVLGLASSFASASDPSPLQDFCVAVKDSEIESASVFVNGKFCKNPKDVTANDFFFSGLDKARDTSNRLGSNVTQLNVDKIAGLNTLGISLARIDYAPYGLNPPHIHPRGTEILVVVEGTLEVGFATSNQDENRLFTKVLNKGDVFVFPVGLIHFQFNRGHSNAVAFAGLSSQNAGVITIANSVFGSDPRINPDVLTKAFQVDKNIIDYLQKQFWVDNN